MKKLLIAILSMAPLFVFSQQVAKSLTAANGTFIGFYEYKPTDYSANPNTRYPLIIFLHGIGERGDGVYNLPLVLANGIPRNINNGHTMRFFWNGKWETFLVLSPQLSNVYGDWPTFYVDEMIKYAKQNMRIDTNRIFLTGLSLGGGGVWRFASQSYANASQLAGIAPVCGTCAVTNACNMTSANLPVWAFHAQNDGVVGVGCTTSSILAINNCNPAVKPVMSLYADGGHGIWDRAYDTDYNWHNINMYEWFLGQNKSLPVNRLPVARAGNDQTISSLLGTVSLNASASTDDDGNIVRYIWRKISGPSVGSIVSAISTDGIGSVTGLLTAGTYQYEVKVVDNRGGFSLDTVTISASLTGGGGNAAPVANAGADQNISGSSTTLNGSSSYDTDGSIASWRWAKTSGPAQFTLSSTSIANPTLSNLVAGVYQFSLTVTDNQGATAVDYVQVTVSSVANQVPVAKAGNDQSITLPLNNITLDGSGSYDSDGIITSWGWSKISGPTSYSINSPQGISTTVTGLTQGIYQFVLTVTDNTGVTGKDTVFITVNAAPLPNPTPPNNQAPVANAGTNVSISLPANSTTLNGSASSDPDGSITSYVWSKIGGPDFYTASSLTAPTVSLTNLVQGLYTFRLIVTDNAGASSTAYVTVTVNTAAPNQAPVANAGADISITLPAGTATLSGSSSYDADGSISSWSWTKLSGPSQGTITNPSASSTTITNLAQGTYQFRLTVTDNGGLTSSDDVTVVVNAALADPGYNLAPVANAGGNGTITLPSNTYTLNGGASADADGSIISYQWNKIAGPDTYTAGNLNNVTVTLSNLLAGTYTFRLVVVDNKGAMGIDYMSVTVNNSGTTPANQLPVAIAGPSFSITLPTNSTTLNGSSSYDPDGTIASWTWSKVSGPAAGTITSPATPSTGITNLVQGTYQFRLTVKDNAGASASATVNVIVNPGAVLSPSLPPIAKAGNDITITLPSSSASLNGYNSYDPDGSISAWGWTQVSGPSQAAIANPGAGATTVTGLTQGVYLFSFFVTDNTNQTARDTVQVTVSSTVAGQVNGQIAAEAEKLMVSAIKAYPNPAINTINIRVSSANTGKATLNILDMNGRIVRTYEFTQMQSTQEIPVNISSLTNGVYIAEAVWGQKKLTTRFVKQ